MATPILIVCPKCGKQIKAPENALGKKVRCKFCQGSFVASMSGSKPPPAGKAAAKPVQPAKPPLDDDDDDDPNPYVLVDVSLSPRCPDCANEIEEGQIVCLHCGYNMRTRMKGKLRRVYDLTFGQHFLWLLPGIACALTVLTVIGFNIWYLLKINDVIDWDRDPWYLVVWIIGGIKLWVVIMSLGIIWYAGKFAFKRLVLHPKPPEVEKLK